MIFCRSRPSLRTCLQHITGQIWYIFVNLIRLIIPELNHSFIQRVISVESSHRLRTREVNGQQDSDRPSTQHFCQPLNLWQKFRFNDSDVGVYVIDGTAIDTD